MKMKGGACCTVSSCRNSTAKKGIKFFRFPNPKEPERSKRWILACNRKDLLDKDPNYLYKNRRICSVHFPDSMYLNDLKNRLISTAEPTLHLGISTSNEDIIKIDWKKRVNLFNSSQKVHQRKNDHSIYFTPRARVVNFVNSTSTLLDIDLCKYNLNEHPTVDNLPKICRICFMENDVQDIFSLKFDKLLLSDILQTHTQVKIQKGGLVPHKMCISCIEELIRSYLFFKKFQNADKVLHEIALKDKLIIMSEPVKIELPVSSDYLLSENASQKYKTEIIQEFCGENTISFNVMECFENDLSESIINIDSHEDTYGDLIIDLPVEITNEENALECVNTEKFDVVPKSVVKCNKKETISNDVKHKKGGVNKNKKNKMLTTSGLKSNKSLQCEKCKKYFSSRDSLNKHARLHVNPNRVTCYKCNKTYSSKTALKTHQLVHSGEKPHTCEICGLKFRQHSHYLTHKRTHTGEKPYECSYCTESFASTGLLDMHVRKKHTNQPICKCTDCGKGFFEKRQFKKHRLTKHGDLTQLSIDNEKPETIDGELSETNEDHSGGCDLIAEENINNIEDKIVLDPGEYNFSDNDYYFIDVNDVEIN